MHAVQRRHRSSSMQACACSTYGASAGPANHMTTWGTLVSDALASMHAISSAWQWHLAHINQRAQAVAHIACVLAWRAAGGCSFCCLLLWAGTSQSTSTPLPCQPLRGWALALVLAAPCGAAVSRLRRGRLGRLAVAAGRALLMCVGCADVFCMHARPAAEQPATLCWGMCVSRRSGGTGFFHDDADAFLLGRCQRCEPRTTPFIARCWRNRAATGVHQPMRPGKHNSLVCISYYVCTHAVCVVW